MTTRIGRALPTGSAMRDAVFERKRNALSRAMVDENAARTIVFCNSIEQCRRVENILKRDASSGPMLVLPYHAAVDAKMRDAHKRTFGKPLLETPVVLVCTDRASRGIIILLYYY